MGGHILERGRSKNLRPRTDCTEQDLEPRRGNLNKGIQDIEPCALGEGGQGWKAQPNTYM